MAQITSPASTSVPPVPNTEPAPGFGGGFLHSNPLCAYTCDLSSLSMSSNSDNIKKIKRQMRALWPEFSWIGPSPIGSDAPTTRYFQMFAPDISRVGYDDRGQTWSILCPQQGLYFEGLGTLNVEVTVTNQRGWVDESMVGKVGNNTEGAKSWDHIFMAADIIVRPRIWFSPSTQWTQAMLDAYTLAVDALDISGFTFPLDKPNAIELITYDAGGRKSPDIEVRDGALLDFASPIWAVHDDEAWAVAGLAVEIGPLAPVNPVVDEFNALVMKLFNLVSGNMLAENSVLAWNVWLDAPAKASYQEWLAHAKKWRESIDNGTGYPEGQPSIAKDFNGTPFSPDEALVEAAWAEIEAWLKKYGVTLPSLPMTGNGGAGSSVATSPGQS